MFRFFNLFLFLILPFAFSGCSKTDKKISVLTGIYSGTFYRHLLLSSLSPAGSGSVTVTFSENNYTCTANPNRIPAGGSGNYQISNQEVQFKDTNIWTADFDWGLILNGTYTVERKSDSLILTKITSTTLYEYRLKRIN